MKRIEGITKGELEELYVEKKFGSPKCGEILGVDPTTVLKWLRKYGIPTRSVKDCNQRLSCNIPKETLEDLYIKKGYSTIKCAEILGVCHQSILNYLHKYHIPIYSGYDISKEKLEELYLEKTLSTRQCAKIFGCGRGTINNKLHEYCMPVRHPTALKANITKEILMDLYTNKKLSISQCANALDCKQTTIAKKLESFKIRIRSKSEGCMLRDDARSDITKEKLIDLYLNHEQSTIVCADYFECNKSSILLKLKKFGIPIRSMSEAFQNSFNTGRRKKVTPNKEEEELFTFIEEACPGEYKYTGDRTLWIGGLNPDFAHCGDKKKLIEYFGWYWHVGKVAKRRGWKVTEFGRKAIFSQLGYDTLVIWDKEMKNKEKVIEKLKEFNSRQILGHL